jgi:hypothetical protein
MKIAVLTSARTGSTSLYRLIDRHIKSLGFTCVSEPFNNEWRGNDGLKTYDVDFFERLDNVFTKTFVSKNQIPKSFESNEQGYWDWFLNYFDKIILLDRKDKRLQGESLVYHQMKNDIKSWQNKQYYDLSNISDEQMDSTINHLIKESEIIHSYTNFGYPIFYFEDLYINKDKSKVLEIFDYIGLTLNNTIYNEVVVSDIYKIRLDVGEGRFKSII